MGDAEGLRVLVVDDEPNISDLVATVLRYEGFEVEVAATGRRALRAAAEFDPALIVLDVMLPDLDGFEVHRRLTAEGRTAPVLFLTARDATEDKVKGLSLGGDDYVTKPFSLEELVARVRSILRRTAPAREERATSVLRYADLQMDEDAHEVSRAGDPIDLTATEYNLLRYLMLNPRRVLSKGQILDHVWHYDFAGEATVVETFGYTTHQVELLVRVMFGEVKPVGKLPVSIPKADGSGELFPLGLALVLGRRFGLIGVPLASLCAQAIAALAPASLRLERRASARGFGHYPSA